MSPRPFIALLLLPCLGLPGLAGQDVAAVKDYELEDGARQLMRGIRDDWMKQEYPRLLREHRLRMSCAACESIYLDVQLTIDAEGRVARYKVVAEKRCGRTFTEAMRKDFVRYYQAYVFPPELRNRAIETRLGTSLTC